MRVLHITRDFQANGGIGRYVMDLSSAMTDAGDSVAVVCSASAPGMQAHVHVIPGCDEFECQDRRKNQAAVMDVAAAFAPDLVLLHAMDDNGLELALRQRFRVARFVHNHVHCPSGLDYDERALLPCDRRQGATCAVGFISRRCWSLRRPWTAERFGRRSAAAIANLRSASLVFTASRYVRGRLVRQGVDAQRVVVAPYFVPSCAPAPVRRARGPEPVLLFVGRIVAEKGLAYLLRAMAAMRSPARLVVNGDRGARR